MSKKKRRPQAAAPAKQPENKPATEKNDNPAPDSAKPAVTEHTIIDQLFGSLEGEPDIEQDIAKLGAEPEDDVKISPEKPKKHKFFFGFAVFVIIMAVIGCVSTVRFAANATSQLFDNSSLKNEFAQFIFPVVVNDIGPFENTSEIPNSTKITCAIWNILINKDTAQYQNANTMGLSIPEYDVSAACKEIFGGTVTVEHQSVGTGEVRFTYDAENHVYAAQKNIRYLTYSPYIVEMSESNGIYRLIVGYLPPTVASVAGINGMEASPEKYMEYTIERSDKKNTLLSVRFSDYNSEQAAG